MAEFVQWTPQISVGIQEIDEQHKQLIQLLNKLFEVMLSKSPERDRVAQQTLHEVVNYTKIHFAVEESLFRIFNYPGYDEHKGKHDQLKSQVDDITRRVQSGEKRIDTALLVFLRNWVTQHIMEEDKQYSGFLLQQGVQKSWAKKSWFGRLLV